MQKTGDKIAIIGAGSWGTALAIVLSDNGHEVRLWGHKPEQINEINTLHTNGKYLPDITLQSSIVGFSSLEEALDGIKIIVSNHQPAGGWFRLHISEVQTERGHSSRGRRIG